MQKYKIVFAGSAGIEQLVFDKEFVSEGEAKAWIKARLPLYYHTYWYGSLHHMNSDNDGILLATYSVAIEVKEVVHA